MPSREQIRQARDRIAELERSVFVREDGMVMRVNSASANHAVFWNDLSGGEKLAVMGSEVDFQGFEPDQAEEVMARVADGVDQAEWMEGIGVEEPILYEFMRPQAGGDLRLADIQAKDLEEAIILVGQSFVEGDYAMPSRGDGIYTFDGQSFNWSLTPELQDALDQLHADWRAGELPEHEPEPIQIEKPDTYEVWHRDGDKYRKVAELDAADAQSAFIMSSFIRPPADRPTGLGDIILTPDGEEYKAAMIRVGTFESPGLLPTRDLHEQAYAEWLEDQEQRHLYDRSVDYSDRDSIDMLREVLDDIRADDELRAGSRPPTEPDYDSTLREAAEQAQYRKEPDKGRDR